jgi:hypothetical protein
MVIQVVIGRRGKRVAENPSVHPRRACQRPVVPNLVHVVVDHIAVVLLAVGRRIKPPNFVVLAVEGRLVFSA